MNIAHNESPKILTIIPLGYRARCTEAGCRNLGRVIIRHFDSGGCPMDNAEFCNAHARVRIERDRAAGLRVYDDRETAIARMGYGNRISARGLI